jgi:hypothetical protein
MNRLSLRYQEMTIDEDAYLSSNLIFIFPFEGPE